MHTATTTRTGRHPARAGGPRPGWTVLVALVVMGILGMHAIGLHGSQHTDPGDLSATAVMPMMAGHHVIPALSSAPHGQPEGTVMDEGEVATLVSPLDLGHGMAGMAMLCVAVLVGAAMVRMLMRSRRGLQVPLRERVTPSIHAARRTDARQTGPTMLCAFSVIRC